MAIKCEVGRTHLPVRADLRPVPDPERLNLHFLPRTGFAKWRLESPNASQRLALQEAGVSAEELDGVLRDLAENVLALDFSNFEAVLLSLSIIGSPCLLYCGLKFESAFREWLQRSNEKVFAPKGLHIKVQCRHSAEGPGDTWLAVSLTRPDAAMLRAEAHHWELSDKGGVRLLRPRAEALVDVGPPNFV